jgi:mannose-6-phosphate isomerase-like protein (cupin superfamily)
LGTKEEEVGTGVRHVPPNGGRSLWVLGELARYKTASDQTGGAYSLFEVITQPGGGPPPHVHHREDESFYVLKGHYEFVVEGHTTRAGSGFLLYVPKGNLHAHKKVGRGVGRMLVSQTPGGLYEGFFEEVGELVDGEAGSLFSEDQPNVTSIVAIAAKYGIEIPVPVAEETWLRNATKGGQQ